MDLLQITEKDTSTDFLASSIISMLVMDKTDIAFKDFGDHNDSALYHSSIDAVCTIDDTRMLALLLGIPCY